MRERGRRIRRPDQGPQPVANSMAKLLGRLGAPQSLDTIEVIFTRWPEVVGAELAAHLQPVRVHGNVLVVSADHPTWVTRCRMDAERIVATARALGDTTVERVEVVLQRPQ
jgi:predicted nucleic acid-binding Zn ribbon protein